MQELESTSGRGSGRIRCYACARLQRGAAAQCERCGANFRALCVCGAEMSAFADACPNCGAAHPPKRLPFGRHPYVRAGRWVLVAACAGLVAWASLAPRETPTWRLKEQGFAAYARGDFEAAARAYRDVTETTPEDAAPWYMLALAYKRLGHAREVYLPLAEKAVLLAPGLQAARHLLVRSALEAGDVGRALEHAEAAARSPGATGEAHQLRAEVELARPVPNFALVQTELEEARAAGVDTPVLRVLLAEVCVRVYGAHAGDAAKALPGMASRLREALPALDSPAFRDLDPSATAVAKSRLLLALGEADLAFAGAETALGRLDSAAPGTIRAELRLFRGLALCARGSRAEGMSDLAAALRARPDGSTAATACGYLYASGDVDGARALLVQAASSGDPTGAIHAVLADFYCSLGEHDLAMRAIEAARTVAPNDGGLAAIEGSVQAARGDLDRARAAYAEAARLAPHDTAPRLALATLDVAVRGASGGAAEKALAGIEAVRAEFGEDAHTLFARGRVRSAQGDHKGACEDLERAAVMSPASPDVWLALAEARRGLGGPDALARAAEASGRARQLRPRSRAIVLAETELRLASGAAAEAVAACTDYLRSAPDDVAVLTVRAHAARALGMWPSAADDLRRIRARGGGSDAAILLVDTLYNAGDADSARRVADEVAPGVGPEGRAVLAVIAALHRRAPDEALAALANSPPSVLRAELQLLLGRRDDALTTLRGLWTSSPGDDAVARLLVVAILDAARPSAAELDEARAVAAALAGSRASGVADFAEGRILLAAGDAPSAAERLSAAAAVRRNDALVALSLGEALFRAGDRNRSLSEFRRALTLPGAPAGAATIVAARVLSASAETTDAAVAERLAQEALRIDPENAHAADALAAFLSFRGAHDDAAEIAERAAARRGLAPEMRSRLALRAAAARCAAGQGQRAVSLLKLVSASDRGSPLGHTVGGAVLAAAGRHAEADAEFKAALEEQPELGAAALGRAEVALRTADAPRAEDIGRAWLAAHPADETFALAFAQRLARFDRGESARRALDAFVAGQPGAHRAAAELARMLVADGAPAEAIRRYETFARAAPPSAAGIASLQLARLMLFDATRLGSALESARTLAASPRADEPQRRAARAIEAEALLRLGRVAEAEVVADEIARAWPADGAVPVSERGTEASVRFVLGTAAAAEPRRRSRALDQLTRAHELAPHDHGVANNLAWLLAQRSETAQRGLEIARRATASSPTTASYWDTRGKCAERAEDFADAEQSYARALTETSRPGAGTVTDRARAELELARFLRARGREDDARRHAAAAATYAKGTAAADEAARFLNP